MHKFFCECGARIFFDNVACSSCDRPVGWCDTCDTMTTRLESGCCSHCDQPIEFCSNHAEYGVCNRFVVPNGSTNQLCRSCERTTVIPAATPENLRRLKVMESAKRRLLCDLHLIGLSEEQLNATPRLTFEFKADTPTEHVITGHADGVITINLREADPVAREKARQQFGETQRTVIGHLRHECGHYLWNKCVEGICEDEFRQLFGDHCSPPYAEAMDAYYKTDPPQDWQQHFISQYASAHPWEDFAETAAFYLDMRSVMDTLQVLAPELVATTSSGDFDQLLCDYLETGIALNEVNRTLGLTDLVPEVISPEVKQKLRFVHNAIANTAKPQLQTTA